MAAKVFISYRQGDSAGYAGRVMDRLDRELGRDKRQVLGWLGGGLVVAATGLWAAFVYVFPPGKSPLMRAGRLGRCLRCLGRARFSRCLRRR
jgi:hypothetical protein